VRLRAPSRREKRVAVSTDDPAKDAPVPSSWVAACVRALGPGDVPACVRLAAARGWATDADLWTRFLALGEGLGVDHDGELVAAVVLNRFGPHHATLAMMLVAAAHGRRGLGVRLVTEALARARDATVALYASEMGRPLYARLGFVDAGASRRLEGAASLVARATDGLRRFHEGDLARVIALDAKAQGAPRARLVTALATGADRAWVVERGGALAAFGFASLFRGTRVLSPIVAAEDADARAIAGALAEGATEPLRIDLEPGEEALHDWAVDAGLAVVATTPRMVHGRPPVTPRRWVRAIAGRPYG
jgi:GNAT superfamily N-acetyltransferase